MADSAPAAKDVIIATVGASAALAGLILVFLGSVVATYQALPATATEKTKARAKRPIWPSLVAFLLTMADVALGAIWLDANGSHTLYEINFVVFLIGIVAVAGLAIATAWGPIKGGS